MIDIEDVYKEYRNGKETTIVLKGVSFKLKKVNFWPSWGHPDRESRL